MNDLLKLAIEGHGGMPRWKQISRFRVVTSITGAIWALKGMPGMLDGVVLEGETRDRRLTITPFLQPGQYATWEPYRQTIETAGGALVAERHDPLVSFAGLTRYSPWDEFHVAYFASEANWNYFVAPFIFARGDFITRETGLWREDGQTWRTLLVIYPDTLVAHHRRQTCYFDDAGLLRRLDYSVDVLGGGLAVHYPSEYREFDGSWCRPAAGFTSATPTAPRSVTRHQSLSTSPMSPSARSKPMRADIVPGGVFPDYELTDHTRTRRTLSELQGVNPMILLLSRGHFCPKDNQQHLELAANYPKIAVAYTQMVTISTDNIVETNEFRASVGAQWTFLSDAGRKIARDLDIAEYTDPFHDPMIPYTFVLKPGLVIHSVYNGYWFWGRPSFEDLRRDLREVTREIRPDWDLAAPGLRENWDADDHTMHHPYQPADHMTVASLPVRE